VIGGGFYLVSAFVARSKEGLKEEEGMAKTRRMLRLSTSSTV
jgi:hypothetical protein